MDEVAFIAEECKGWLTAARVEGPRHLRSVESNVTLAWGVRWNHEEVARDVLQNFYDANRDQIDKIEISGGSGCVSISAPAKFDLNRLYFLGSEKDASHVGQYGEGFKAAAVSYLREPGRYILAVSGDQALIITPSKQPIAGTTKLFPLVYHFYGCQPSDGTRLVLANCPRDLATCLSAGLENFFFPTHPRLGKLLFSNPRVAMYHSTGPDGCLFYRNLKRGELVGIPLVFKFEKSYAAIERKIGADRDRKEFGSEIRGFFLKQIVDSLLRAPIAQRRVLEACRVQWEGGQGNQLLHLMSGQSPYYLVSTGLFEDRFYAHTKPPEELAGRLQHEQIIQSWKNEGRIELPGYFAKFGAITVEAYLQKLEEKAKADAMAQGRRPPNTQEASALKVLSESVMLLSPSLSTFLLTTNIQYTLAKTDVLLGQFKAARSYRSKEIFFSSEIFEMEFSQALALYMHEHAHIFGYDSSRGFTDALTSLLEATIENRSILDDMEADWSRATKALRTEVPLEPNALAVQAATLPKDKLESMLARLKPGVLEKLLAQL